MKRIEELKIINQTKKEALKSKGEDYRIQEIIEQLLEDDNCFYKTSKEEAFLILQNLDIKKDQLEKIYNDLKENK